MLASAEFSIADSIVGEARVIGRTTINARAVGFDAQSRHVVYSQVVIIHTH